MAIEVKEIIEDATWETINGGYLPGRSDLVIQYRATRAFIVTGLDLNTLPAARIALATMASGIPKVGDDHPAQYWVWCVAVSGRLSGPEVCKVVAEYESGPEWNGYMIDVGTNGTLYESVHDLTGAVITKTINGKNYTGRYNFERVDPVVRVVQPAVSLATLIDRCANYNNTVSDGGPLGGAERTWRCTVSGRPSGWGQLYNIEWEFQYNSDKWDAYCEWGDASMKRPDDYPVESDCRVQVYKEKPFPLPDLVITN